MAFLFPDLAALSSYLFGLDGVVNNVFLLFISFMLFFGLVLLAYFIEYTKFPILLFEDRIEFRESIFLKENYKIPYKNIIDIKVTANPVQKYYGLKTLKLNLNTGADHLKTRDYWVDFHDLKNADNIAGFITDKMNSASPKT